MARQEVVDIAIRADIEQLKAQLKSIPGMSDDAAKKMAGNISKQLNKAAAASEKAAAKSQKAWKKSATSLDATERASAKAASTMGKFASALSTVSPEAATAAQVIQKAADGVEALAGSGTKLTASLGVIGVALAAAGAAYLHFRNEIAKTDEAIRVNRERLSSMVEVHRQVKEAAILSAVAQGQMSQEAADGYMIAQRAGDIFADRIEEQRKRVSELKNSLHEAKQAHEEHGDASHAATGLVVLDMFMATQGATDNADAVQGLTQQLEREETALTRLNQIKDRYVEVTTAGAEATLAQRNAVKLESDETDKSAKAAEDAAKAAQGAADARARWNMELAQAQDADQAAVLARVVELQNAVAEGSLDAADAQTLLNKAVAEYEAAVKAAAAIAKAEDERKAAALEAEARARQEYSIALVSGHLAALETIAGEHERLFRFEQAAAIAQVLIDAAVAAMKAYAVYGPTPAAAAASLAVGGIAGLQIAAITAQEPPTYHTGGTVRAPDEVGITARRGEGVLTRQGVEAIGGTAALDAANRGAGAPATIRIDHVYKARSFGVVFGDSYGMAGSPVRQAIRTSKGRRVGHRDV